MHGDYRLDNLLFAPDRTAVTVVDWQTLGAGLPARDLAYFAATSLLPEARGGLDHTLVDAYHDELLTYGITGYDRETCWRDYRLGMLQAPLLTTLGCAFASTTERGDEMMLVMLQRGCQAIRDLGSMELVSAS
jgi:aminoglycoside phosphotransferase (APT) family kinase protein